MECELVEQVRDHRLSAARRLFVLEEMLANLPDDDSGEIAARIERLMAIDRQNLRHETRTRRYVRRGFDVPESTSVADPDDATRLQRAHSDFVELIAHITSSLSVDEQRPLTTPVHRQLERLRSFAERPDTSPEWTPKASSSDPFERPLT